MKISLLLLLTLAIHFSCSSPKHLSEVSSEETLLKYSRSACFGTCPVYEVLLTRSGTTYFVGKRFVPIMDTLSFTLDSRTLRDIKAIQNLESYQNIKPAESNVEVMDVPVLHFSDRKKGINLELKMNIPGEIQAITDRIDRELTARYFLPGEGENALVRQEIILEFVPEIDPFDYNQSFRFYELNYMDKIADNIYLFRLVTTQSLIGDALADLTTKDAIIAAQKNHELEHR